MRIASIIGARPQFIKLKPLVDGFEKRKIEHISVHTGQHYDYEMSKIFFDKLKIPKPDYNLGVGSDTHGRQTALMVERIEKVLIKEKPALVIVYGDTNSTLAGALAAVKLCIAVAHVEAGLRSYRLDMPEEVNRVLTDHISTLLFCPTKTALSNLKREGITRGVYLVGDVMRDIFKSCIEEKRSKIIQRLGLMPKGYHLLTLHRQENTQGVKKLKAILHALRRTEEKILFPVHPRTRKALKKIRNFKMKDFKNFLFIKPVGYFDMLALEKNAEKILTDSGGIQKEASWLGTPCITLRDETEWVETVRGKMNILAGADVGRITQLVKDKAPNLKQRNLLKEEDATGRIIKIIEDFI